MPLRVRKANCVGSAMTSESLAEATRLEEGGLLYLLRARELLCAGFCEWTTQVSQRTLRASNIRLGKGEPNRGKKQDNRASYNGALSTRQRSESGFMEGRGRGEHAHSHTQSTAARKKNPCPCMIQRQGSMARDVSA